MPKSWMRGPATTRTIDPRIAALRDEVAAAQQEFDLAVMFHEVWKPTAYDKELHARMGKSYAAQAFLITKIALRREMMLALMRLWDKSRRAVCMQSIAADLRRNNIIDLLARDRVDALGLPDAFDEMRIDFKRRMDEVVALVSKYTDGGSHEAVLKKLLSLRHEQLAHRQVTPSTATATGADATDVEIEQFYQDNSKLVHILLSLVNAVAYEPEETAKVYRRYAGHFWAGARGERTEGHPNYKPRLAE